MIRLLAVAGMLLGAVLSQPLRAEAQEIVVFPNALAVSHEDGRPLISVREVASHLEATISYETSWEESLKTLKARYGEAYFDLSLVKLNLLPRNVDFASAFFTEANSALIDVRFTYDVNRVTVRFKFKKDFTTGQIREAIQFPISLGTVDAEVTCLGSIVLDRCGAELKRVPLVNAFARNGEPEVHLRRAHYTYLRSYASHLGITASPYLSDAFSAEVKANHWEGGLCSAASGDWHRDACEITAKYSRMLSLKEAITALGRTVFPDDAFLNADYFLYAGATFNVKHLNLAIDFRTIRDRLNADFVLRTENVALPLNVPLISNVRLSTRYAFQILRDSMCWRSRSLALITGLHLRGSSNLTFTSFFTHYSVPVEYDIAMGFDYDPFTEEVTVSDVRVANMDFPLIPGNGREVALRAREPIERAINVYLSSAEYRQAVSHNVRSFLKALQSANIGFEPFATN